jgi:thiosulfate/3-mercaptopyruvate sulfurtransferase
MPVDTSLPSPLVTTEWLAANLDSLDCCIVDCRFQLADPDAGSRQYQRGHIPGAYYLDLNRDLADPPGSSGGRHPLPSLDRLARTLSNCGIGERTRVIAYDDSRFAFAARLWWLLKYAGHENVSILDGGYAAWLAGNHPITEIVPPPADGNFIPQPQPDYIASRAEVALISGRSNDPSPNSVLTDARENDRYLGKIEPIDPIAGHIPGAINYPWQEVTDAAGFAKSPAELQQRWQNISDRCEIISYCGSGVTACVNILSLAIAQRPIGKLYVGSWSDWCTTLHS